MTALCNSIITALASANAGRTDARAAESSVSPAIIPLLDEAWECPVKNVHVALLKFLIASQHLYFASKVLRPVIKASGGKIETAGAAVIYVSSRYPLLVECMKSGGQ